MLEGRFKELISLFLDGEIHDAELTWLADEIRADAKRRETFLSEIRIHLATCEAMRSEHGVAKLRDLEEMDLESVKAQTLRLYVPRKDRVNLATLASEPESEPESVPETTFVPSSTSRRQSVSRTRMIPEPAGAQEKEKGYYLMPTIGLLLIVGMVFALYWNDTHPESGSGDGENPAVADDGAAPSDAPDFRVLYQVAGFSEDEGKPETESAGKVEEFKKEDGVPVFLKLEANSLRPTGSEEIRVSGGREENESGSRFRYLGDSAFQYVSAGGQ